MSEGLEKLLPDEEIDAAVAEYELNVEAVAAEFKERTRLQDADATFVILATALQILRIVFVQLMRPKEQAAGKGNEFEEKLKAWQKEHFKKTAADHKNLLTPSNDNLYASLNHIITTRGVPYDATAPFEPKLKLALFKGANHRFSTLGHDPLLGLVFGTSNILTNTISTSNKALLRVPVIKTHHVSFDALGKNPRIDNRPTSSPPQLLTIPMLEAAGNRLKSDKPAVAAALIKQLIHIGTDVYTTKGIQLPLSGLVLDSESVDKLTDYVDTADALEFTKSAGMAIFINWIISSLHGCTLIFQNDGTDYCSELYQTRTRKIISLSNAIATSSNLIAKAIKPDAVRLDLGGLAVTLFRLISDTMFITKLKYEYLNSEVSKIYEARGDGYVDPEWLDEEICLERLGLK